VTAVGLLHPADLRATRPGVLCAQEAAVLSSSSL